jgi:rare lipoprotein A
MSLHRGLTEISRMQQKKSSTFSIVKRLFLLVCVFHLSHSLVFSGTSNPCASKKGTASFYDRKFEGRRTSSGERYRHDSLTAAHKTLAFGTRVRVTHLSSGKQVVVRVNDRLPMRSTRIIDLSGKAAQTLNMVRAGLAKVEVVCVADTTR